MLKIAVCDDEKSYSELISLKIQKCIENNIKTDFELSCFSSVDSLYEHILIDKPSIVFLDIIVNEINAVNWLTEHQIEFSGIQFIIMTGYPTETENLSEINCCYFLLKSKMTDEHLLRALKRSVNSITKDNNNLHTVSYGKKNYTIDYQSIVYIESYNNNIILHFSNGENITLYSTMKKFVRNLPPNFLQCHKCYVVNMNFIHGYEPHNFVITNGEKLPVPQKKYKAVISDYKNYILNL